MKLSEGNENDLEVLVREMSEELNITIKPETAKFVVELSAQATGKPEGTLVIEKFYTADFEGEFQPSNEIENIEWISYEDINTKRTTPIGNLLLQYLKDHNTI